MDLRALRQEAELALADHWRTLGEAMAAHWNAHPEVPFVVAPTLLGRPASIREALPPPLREEGVEVAVEMGLDPELKLSARVSHEVAAAIVRALQKGKV